MAGFLRRLARSSFVKSLRVVSPKELLRHRFRRTIVEVLERRDLMTGVQDLMEPIELMNDSMAPSAVVGRWLFYNHATSAAFGDGSGNPINAIDPTKAALLPNETSTFANYSNYLQGLNGILVDMSGPVDAVTAADFLFATSDGLTANSFVPIDASASVSIFPGGGAGGSNRIKLEFPDGRIRNTWLRVIVLANAKTGLHAPDVFYFGNAIGDMNVGNRGSPTIIGVNAADVTFVRQNQSIEANTVSVSNLADINKDGRVNGTDTSILQQYQRSSEFIGSFTAPALNRAPIGQNQTVLIHEDESYFFTEHVFGFSDPHDTPANSFQAVKITTLPDQQQGRLLLNGLPITVGQNVLVPYLSALSFQPAVNLHGDSLGFFTFQVIDSGTHSSMGSENIDQQPRIFSFDIAPIADGPTISSLSDVWLLEDSTGTTEIFSISDPDTAWDDLTISIASSNESLVASSGLILERSNDGFRLRAIPKPDRSGIAVVEINVNDGVLSTIQSMTLTVIPVNDAPTSGDGFRSIQEEQVVGLRSSDFPLDDSVDTPSDEFHGIEIKSLSSSSFGQLRLSGAPISVGTFIPRNAIEHLTFTPATDFTHARWKAFTFLTYDDGSLSNGGKNFDPIERTFYFEIRDIHDPPTISPLPNVSIDEDSVTTPITFSVTDSDTPVSQLTVAIVSSNPTLIDGQGMTITRSGSTRQIRLAPKANQSGISTLTVSVGDGVSTTSTSFTVTVVPVNDPPSGRSSLKSVVEDGSFLFRTEDFQFSDSNDSPSHGFEGIFIDSIADPTLGRILRNQIPVAPGSFVPHTELGQLSFVPAANQIGRSVLGLTFRVQDSGGVANGGVHRDTILRTISFEILSVNDPPIALNVLNQELHLGQRYHFSSRDFRFDDPLDGPANSLQEVIILTIPNASDGKLQLAGREVNVNQSIPASHLTQLVFTPDPDALGTDRGAFQFRIRDDGGTYDSGMNLSENIATFSFRVLSTASGPVERIELAADASVRTIYEPDFDSYFAGRGYTVDDGIPATWFANQGTQTTLRSARLPFASLVYLKVDLTGIRPGFASIALNLKATGSRALENENASDLDQIASLVSSYWDEETVVEENAPGIGKTIARWSVQSRLGSPQSVSIDLTSTIKSALERGENSISFVVHASTGESGFQPMGEVTYASRESEAFSDRPHLVLRYPETNAPITAPSSIQLDEDTQYVFSFADFPYPVSNNEDASGILVRSLPNAGRLGIRAPIDPLNPTLERALVAVTVGQSISRSVIDAGRFEFIPAGELSGKRISSFDFSVVDTLLRSSAAATMSIDILANDALTILHLGSFFHQNGSVLFGAHYDDDTGRRISNAGDVNRDGFDDLLIGAPEALVPGGITTGEPTTDTTRWFGGKVYLVYGGPSMPDQIDLLSLGTAGVVIVGAQPRDSIGRGLSGGGDLNGDGYPDILVGGQAGSSSGVGPGNSYVILGGPALPEMIDLNMLGDRGIAIYGRDAPDQSGFSVAFAGDVNGDGIDDLAIGAYRSEGYANEREDAGETYILFGRKDLPSEIHLGDHGAVDVTIYGEDWGDQSGYSIKRAGDVNDDGYDDLLIGARLAAPEVLGTRDPNSNVILVIPHAGGSAIPDGSIFSVIYRVNEQTKTLVFEFDANASGPTVGTNILISEYDGKSPDEVANRIGTAIRNAFYDQGLLFYPKLRQNGRLDLDLNEAQIDISLTPALRIEHHFVPVYGTERPDGASYLIYGGPALPDVMKLESLGEAGVKIYGNLIEGPGDANNDAPTIQFGASVSGAGDVNGDGYDDILVGAPKHGNFSGAAVLIFGGKHLPQRLDRQRLLQLNSWGMFLYGDAYGDDTGISVSTAGDFNGDGYSDIVVGVRHASLYDPTSRAQNSPYFPDVIPEHEYDFSTNGRSYVIFGNPNLPSSYSLRDLFAQGAGGESVPKQSNPEILMLTGSTPIDSAGHAVSNAGDLDGDGYDDLLVAAPRAKPRGLNSGQVHIVYGNAFSRLDTVEGTSQDDIDLTESALSSIVVGGRGNDRLVGTSRTVVLRGGEGDDRLVATNTSFRQVIGGTGNDQLILPGTGETLDLTLLPDNRIQGIEEIDIQGHRLRLSFRDVIRISDESNTLIIHGTTGETEIGAGWTQQPDEIRGSTIYHVFTQGVATLHVQRSVSPIFNSAPVGSDRTQSLAIYPSVYSFSVTDFSFQDSFDRPENTLDGIEIVSLPDPNEGSLVFDFLPIAAGHRIHVSQIHKLKFIPHPSAIGRGLGSFVFSVIDDGDLGMPISIVNASFELPWLPNDGDSNNTTVPGWQIEGIAGVFNPVSTIYNGVNTTDHQQLAFAADGSLTQELSTVLAPNTRYQLQVDVGDRLDKATTPYRIAIYAGTTLLVDATHTNFETLNGGFVTATLLYTSPSSSPLVGLPLKIELSSPGDQTNFDRVRFSSVPLESHPSNTDRNSRVFSFDIGVNRPPRGSDRTRDILEDQEYTLQTSDFGFDDSADNPIDAWYSVLIETVPDPTEGTLRLADTLISHSTWIPLENLSSLKFVPTENRSGPGLGAFTFRVQDDGGVLHGGKDTDLVARTIDFNITEVNDPPTIGAIDDITIPEDTTSHPVSVTLSDVELPSELITVRFVSDNPSLLRSEDIVFTRVNGSHHLTVSPQRNQYGNAIVTMSATDGLSIPVHTSFTVYVLPVNDPPKTRTFERVAYRGVPLRLRWDDFRFSDVEGTASPTITFTGSYHDQSDLVSDSGDLEDSSLLEGLRLGDQTLVVNQILDRNSIEQISNPAMDGLFFDPPWVGPGSTDPAYARFTFRVSDGDRDSTTAMLVLRIENHAPLSQSLSVTNISLLRPFFDDGNVDEFNEPTVDPTRSVNPTVTGSLQGDLPASQTATIEFFHNDTILLDDQTAPDGIVTVRSTGMPFIYDPRTSSPSLNDFTGPLTLYYRISYPGVALPIPVQSFSFHKLPVPLPNTYRIRNTFSSSPLAYSAISGSSTPPKGILQGKVDREILPEESGSELPYFGDLSRAVKIDIALDGSLTIHHSFLTESTGAFRIAIPALPANPSSLFLRVREWHDDFGGYLPSSFQLVDWVPLPTSAPVILSLAPERVLNAFANPPTTDQAKVVGQVSLASDAPRPLWVSWSQDNGITWNRSDVDATGNFWLSTKPSTSSITMIRAKAVAIDPLLGNEIESNTSILNFRYVAPAWTVFSELRLANDTHIPLDGITADVTLSGMIADYVPELNLRVEFDIDDDGMADAEVAPASSGRFTYLPALPFHQDIFIRARLKRWNRELKEYEKSDWTNNPPSGPAVWVRRIPPDNPSLSITDLELVGGTIEAMPVPKTSRPAIQGRITGSPFASVRWDHNADSIWDGETQSDASGLFEFEPVGLGLSLQTVVVQAFTFDSVTGAHLAGNTNAVSFELVATLNQASVITVLALLSDSGIDGDAKTRNPIVIGRVTNDGPIENLVVGIDLNSDEIVDATTFTTSDGTFVYTPSLSTFGLKTIKARVYEYDPDSRDTIPSSWESTSFLFEDQADHAPVIRDLVYDDFARDLNTLSQLPVLRGRITNESRLSKQSIELDVNSDSIADLSVFTDDRGAFSISVPDLPEGNSILRVRAREIRELDRQSLTSEWVEKPIFHQPQSITAPSMVELGLVLDTGISSIDKRTSDPRLQGVVGDREFASSITVQIDLDGDYVADDATNVQSNGNWTFVPIGLSAGDHTVRARTRTEMSLQNVVYGEWSPFTFHLLPTLDKVFIDSLALFNDNGTSNHDRATSDATLTGSLGNVSPGQNVTLVFDHNGDGIEDGQTTTTTGTFTYAPANLTVNGWVSLQAQARYSDSDAIGQWSSIHFVLHHEPDSLAAQTELQKLVEFEQAKQATIQAGQAARQIRIDAVKNSDIARKAQVDAASVERNDSMIDAERLAQQANQQANRFRQLEIDAANAAFLNAMQSFRGNSQSFIFDPFTLAAVPATGILQFPNDAQFAIPPRNSPDYDVSLPSIDSDPEFQITKTRIEDAFKLFVSNRSELRRTEDSKTLDRYLQSIVHSDVLRKQDIQRAQNAFDLAIKVSPSDQLQLSLSQTDSLYQAVLIASDAAIARAEEDFLEYQRAAFGNEEGGIGSFFEDHYRDIILPIFEEWVEPSAQAIANNTDPALDNGLYLANTLAHLAATKSLDARQARFVHRHMASWWGRYESNQETIRDLQRDTELARISSREAGRTAYADALQELQPLAIAARKKFEVAKATAEFDHHKRVADAGKARDSELASHVKDETLAVESQRSQSWRDIALARKNTASSRVTAQNTPWARYQLQLATNEYDYIVAIAPNPSSIPATAASASFHDEYWRLFAEGKQARDMAIIQAAHDRDLQIAQAKLDQFAGISTQTPVVTGAIDHVVNYWTTLSVEGHDFEKDQIIINGTLDRDEVLASYRHGTANRIATVDRSLRGNDLTLQAELDGLANLDVFGLQAHITQGASELNRTYFRMFSDLARDDATLPTWTIAWQYDEDVRLAWLKYEQDTSQREADYSAKIADALLAFRVNSALLDWELTKKIAESVRSYEKTIATLKWTFVETIEAPNDQARADHQSLLAGIRQVADTTALHRYRRETAQTYQSAMHQWAASFASASPGSRHEFNRYWSAYHASLGDVEYDWTIEAGNAAIASAQAVHAAEVDQAHAASLAEKNLRIANERAEKRHAEALADARYAFISDPANHLAVHQQAIDSHTNTLRTIARQRSIRDSQFARNATRYATFLEIRRDNQIAADNSINDYELTVRLNAEDVVAKTTLGPINEIVFLEIKNYFPDWASNNASAAQVNAYRAAERLANLAASERYLAVNTALSQNFASVKANAEKTWRSSQSIEPAKLQSDRIRDERMYFVDTTLTKRTYAEGHSDRSRQLAEALQLARVDREREILIADLDRAHAGLIAQKDFDIASTVARNSQTRSGYTADANRRQRQVAARGTFEVAIYQADRDRKLAIALSTPSNLATLQHSASMAQAEYADAIRVSRNRWEEEITRVELSRIDQANAASLERMQSRQTADLSFAIQSRPIEEAYGVAVIEANAHFVKANTDVDIQWELERTNIELDFLLLRKLAEEQHIQSNLLFGNDYSIAIADAHSQAELGNRPVDTKLLATARKAYNDQLKSARRTYAQQIGTALVQRAEQLGTARITFATNRSLADLEHASVSHSALQPYLAAIEPLRKSHGLAIATLENAFSREIAVIDAGSGPLHGIAWERESASVQRAMDDNIPISAFAGSLADAEIRFLIAEALAEKNRMTNAAAAHPNSPQAIYDEAYSAAKHQWLSGLRSQYVLRKTSQASAEATLATDLAIAKRKLVETRLRAQRDFLEHQTLEAYQFSSDQIDTASQRDAGMNQLAMQRWIDKATYTKEYAIEIAIAEKTLAMDRATIEADFQMDVLERLLIAPMLEETDGSFAESQFHLPIDELLEDGFHSEKTRRLIERERVRRKYEDAKDDAEAKWKKADNEARLNFATGFSNANGADNPLRLGESGIEKRYTNTISTRKELYDIEMATLEHARDRALTMAQITAWNEETAAENQSRSSQAIADLDYWMVQENQRLLAHTSILNDLGTPWSLYLVHAAQARIAAFHLARPMYLEMIADQNQSENRHRAALSSAFRTREDAMADARKVYSIVSAESVAQSAAATASAQYDYLKTASIAAKAFADELADHPNANPDAYHAAEAVAWVARQKAMAQVTFESSEAKTNADRVHELAKHKAQTEYRKAESKAYADSVGRVAKIDRIFAIQHAQALMTAAIQSAQSYPTPWSYHDASSFSAEYSRTRKTSLAAEQRSRKLADSQAKSEQSLADIDLAKHTASIAANAQQSSDQARIHRQQANENANIVRGLADLGQYKTNLPTVSKAPDIGAMFTIDSVEMFGFYLAIKPPRSQIEPNSGWDLRSATWFDASEPIWALKASTFDAKTGNYIAPNSDGLRSFTQNPIYSNQAYTWWGYSNTRHWLEFTPSPFGQLIHDANQLNFIVPSKTVDEVFWNLDDEYTLIATPAFATPLHTLNPMEPFARLPEDHLIVKGQKPELPFSIAGSVEIIQGIAKLLTIDEIVRQMQSLNERFAEFILKSGSILESAAARRPANALGEQAIPASSTGQPNLVDQPNRSENPLNHESQFTITFDANVNSPEYEAIRLESELKHPETPHTQAIAQRFQHHIDERTSGYAARNRLSQSDDIKKSILKKDFIRIRNYEVFWTTEKPLRHFPFSAYTERPKYIETKVGVLANDGWVRLLSGNRATLQSLRNMASGIKAATNDQINQALDAAISPFSIDGSNSQFGIFIGGTNEHVYSIGNTSRMYNLYQGTKFFYGGVGNPIDFSPADWPAGAFGNGWEPILDRAEADIKRYLRPGQKIHIFGWSRGAAMANDLAARLSKKGVSVDFVGMFDPVYSVGLAGQDSLKIDLPTDASINGNYVYAPITGNVIAAASIYAINEDRSFFPATRFRAIGNTSIVTMKQPGAHGEVGGHFLSNQNMQQLAFKAMVEFARGHGNAILRYSGIDADFLKVLESPATLRIALMGLKDIGFSMNLANRFWRTARYLDQWSPFTTEEYLAQLESRDKKDWQPGGFGFQKEEWTLFGVTAGILSPDQLWFDHYRRMLPRSDRELWDFPLKTINGTEMKVSDSAKYFIQSLYWKRIAPNIGGWLGELKTD